ncbi:Cysteine-rich membrane protein 1 [Spironucleus salmonicida]|uniref:Cysteine-rich membrane protein 1 n=1 Tax=Spironucleus salmonicida TaxID=348837 RepID=V6LHQ4_9EUKA|nr:Cysteine-rich membrane protein 1 [Spironucleus salmonicida]|eukprot:EST44105.1 Cysteine-rich membrane protein 1 [Spironucleus salmonicida]
MTAPPNYFGNCAKNLSFELNSNDCAHNSFCPIPNFKDDVMCRPCGLDMLPGKSCNCSDNLRQNCAQCNGIHCQSCIRGYQLIQSSCEPTKAPCEGRSENCPHEHFCDGDACKKCAQNGLYATCNCAGQQVQGCAACEGDFCSKCLGSLILANGKCLETVPERKCSNSIDCPVGFSCENYKCRSCSMSESKTAVCNCENMEQIKGCSVCDVGGSGCRQCVSNWLYGIVFGTNYRECQDPKTCFDRNGTGPTSSFCQKQFYCDESVPMCRPCETMFLDEGCFCNPHRKLYNCIKCRGASCQECGYGYFLSSISTGTNCIPNYCTNDAILCLDGYACPKWTQGMAACEECVVGQTVPCQCFYLQNCETCDKVNQHCKACLPGFEFNSETRCVAKQNVCSPNKESFTCNSGNMCAGNSGDNCLPCSGLIEGQFCNCNMTLQQNCKVCEGTVCKTCVDKYLPIGGICVPNMCGEPQNTYNCINGYYCPNTATSGDSVCQECNDQQQECKCGLVPSCQTCGNVLNTCGKCFSGYDLLESTSLCVLQGDICDFADGSTLCITGNYCQGKFGDKCLSCTLIVNGKSCKCGSVLLQNCKECNSDGVGCKSCLDGYYPYNNICVTNSCISGGPSSTCAIGNYCPDGDGNKSNCLTCTNVSPNACQCGANFCQICGSTNNTCGSCLSGYELDSYSQCIIKSNICDVNDRSTLCNDDFFCNSTFGKLCVTCRQIQINESCHCNGYNIQNCNNCNNKKCINCLTGFELVQGECIENNCGDDLTPLRCLPAHHCPPNSKVNDKCEPCAVNINAECNCGIAKNCKTCGVLQGTCQTCLNGYFFSQSTLQCIKIDDNTQNICDKNNQSLRCNNSFFCNGYFGDVCVPCNLLTSGKQCNCNGKLRENCLFCQEQQCKLCITGLLLIDGACQLNKCGPTAACFNGFFCPSKLEESECQLCTTLTEVECNCRDAKNCQTCSIYQDSCQTCLNGFLLVNGFCQPKLPCIQTNDCPLNQYCVIEKTECDICGTQSTQCNCGISINCLSCSTSGTCSSCLPGYGPDAYNSCSVPICSIEVPLGSYCSGPNEVKVCPAIKNQCNCGNAQNCSTCTPDFNACATCMGGSIMINAQCLVSPPGFTGICESTPDSSFCIPGHSCILVPSCSPCKYVSPGYFCNCEGNLYDTCTSCNRDKCGSCFIGYVLLNQACEIKCESDNDCKIGEMCATTQTCMPCDGAQTCNCSGMNNCVNCNHQQCITCAATWQLGLLNQCDMCQSGFELIEMQCLPVQKEPNQVLIVTNIVGMIVACITAVGFITGVVVFYAKRPKKYTFQHAITQ